MSYIPGINSGKSAVVVWKNLPTGGPLDTQTYPRVNLKPPLEAGQGKFFQTTTADFPLFIPDCRSTNIYVTGLLCLCITEAEYQESN